MMHITEEEMEGLRLKAFGELEEIEKIENAAINYEKSILTKDLLRILPNDINLIKSELAFAFIAGTKYTLTIDKQYEISHDILNLIEFINDLLNLKLNTNEFFKKVPYDEIKTLEELREEFMIFFLKKENRHYSYNTIIKTDWYKNYIVKVKKIIKN